MTTTSFRLDDDLEEQLQAIATTLRRSKGWIINDALRLYLAREEQKQQMLKETEEAIADLEAGRVVSGREVAKWLSTWGTDEESAAPTS